MSLEDYSLMREVISAIRKGLPDADQMQPGQVFQHVLGALRNCPNKDCSSTSCSFCLSELGHLSGVPPALYSSALDQPWQPNLIHWVCWPPAMAATIFYFSVQEQRSAGQLEARGGKVVVTGSSAAIFPIAAAMFEGTLNGMLAEARELLDLARARNIAPIPTRNRPLGEAQAALDDAEIYAPAGLLGARC